MTATEQPTLAPPVFKTIRPKAPGNMTRYEVERAIDAHMRAAVDQLKTAMADVIEGRFHSVQVMRAAALLKRVAVGGVRSIARKGGFAVPIPEIPKPAK